jgi:hypothetical protein
VGVDPARFQLVAPYESSASKWLHLTWIDRYSGARYRISTTIDTGGPGVARVQTYRDVLADYRYHPEAKSAGPHGRLYTRQTVGLLGRRVVRSIPELTTHVGKESNRLEEVEVGLEHDPVVIYTEYRYPDRDPWRTEVLPVLRQMPQQELAEAAGMSERRLRDVLGERAQPRKRIRTVLTRFAFARAPV